MPSPTEPSVGRTWSMVVTNVLDYLLPIGSRLYRVFT
jgi:hypothetical protein